MRQGALDKEGLGAGHGAEQRLLDGTGFGVCWGLGSVCGAWARCTAITQVCLDAYPTPPNAKPFTCDRSCWRWWMR